MKKLINLKQFSISFKQSFLVDVSTKNLKNFDFPKISKTNALSLTNLHQWSFKSSTKPGFLNGPCVLPINICPLLGNHEQDPTHGFVSLDQ